MGRSQRHGWAKWHEVWGLPALVPDGDPVLHPCSTQALSAQGTVLARGQSTAGWSCVCRVGCWDGGVRGSSEVVEPRGDAASWHRSPL